MNIESARAASQFVNIMEEDDRGRATRVLVPGHKGRGYCVNINRRGAKMSCSCTTLDGQECQGNKHSLCYHVLSAVIAAAKRSGSKVKLSFCSSKQDAEYLSNLGDCRIYSLKSRQSQKEVWVVARVEAGSAWVC